MNTPIGTGLFLAVTLTAAVAAPRDYPVNPVPFNQVHLHGVFWKPRIDTNSRVTVPVCFKKCEEQRIPNFRRAAKLAAGSRTPRITPPRWTVTIRSTSNPSRPLPFAWKCNCAPTPPAGFWNGNWIESGAA
jgi:hypothetical protein